MCDLKSVKNNLIFLGNISYVYNTKKRYYKYEKNVDQHFYKSSFIWKIKFLVEKIQLLVCLFVCLRANTRFECDNHLNGNFVFEW